MKGKIRSKAQIALSILLWIWIVACIGAQYLPHETLFHNVLTYPPPLLLCLPLLVNLTIIMIRIPLRRANRLDLANFLVCFVLGFCLIGFQVPSRTVPMTGTTVNVLTTNVEKGNLEVPGLSEFIKFRQIELVMMQEVKGGKDNPADKLLKAFPGWSVVHAGEVAIVSRWPLADIKRVPLRSLPGRFILSATVQAPKPFCAVTTHWSVPQIRKGISGLKYTIEAQRHDFEDTLKVINDIAMPTILGGDFNNPPHNGLSRLMSDHMEDAFSTRGWGPGWTYPAGRPFVRIDHLFSNKTISPLQAEVGPSFGSDHQSLFAKFNIE